MSGSKPVPPPPSNTGSRARPSRGAPGRVVEVQAQTRRGLMITVGLAVAAGVAVVVGRGWWLPLHLFTVGALLSAISAVTQMLAVTWSAAPAPRRIVAGAQRWTIAAGAGALVIGRETDQTWLFVVGGVTVVASLLALGGILIWVRRRAVTDRFAPAIEAYVAAVIAGATGMSIGIVLGTGHAGSHYLGLRGAHLTLNVFGLVGLVIAGTLPYFAATQARSKMSPRATPTALRITFAALAAATGVAATGHLVERSGIVAAGLITYVLGLLVIATMLPIYSRNRLRWAGARLVQLVAGVAWWAAMAIALSLATLRETDDRLILQALVVGGFGQILVASLAYLGPVLRGGGHRRLTAGFAITRSWVSLAAGNIAALAAVFGQRPTLAVALVVWLADIIIRGGRLLVPSRSDQPAGA